EPEERLREAAVRGRRRGPERFGPVLGGEPGDVAVVLDEGRNAPEEAVGTGFRSAPCPREVLAGDGTERRVDQFGPPDRGLHGLPRRHPRRADRLGDARRVELAQRIVCEGMDPPSRGPRFSHYDKVTEY